MGQRKKVWKRVDHAAGKKTRIDDFNDVPEKRK